MVTLDTPVLPQYLYRYRRLPNETNRDDPKISNKKNKEDAEIFERELCAIKHQQLFFSNYKSMNDPMEGFYNPTNQAKNDPDFNIAVNAIYDAKLNLGLCCFSDTHNNELMWTHYANNYSDICVGYRPHPLMEGLPADFHLVRVAYGNDPPPLPRHDLGNHRDAARKILSHKKASWVYEREWRLLGRPGLHQINSNTCVERLYVGTRILPKYKERLRKELKDVSIQIFEMSVSNYNHEWVKL